MVHRGRSRDVSPVALARASATRAPAHIAQRLASVIAHCPLATPCDSTTRPVASSSRLPPPPSPLHHPSSLSTSPANTLPRTHSSSSLFSDPGPLTPPDDHYTLDRPLDYYVSPPSPPRSLQDQLHVAYALDNMHLAKVLLLKLQGIEVDGDDDPRIAAVRDEDFSTSFVPEGALLLDADAALRIHEAEQRAYEAKLRREREDRLRRCERVWEKSLRRFKSVKDRVAREKLDAENKRREQEREAKQRDRDRLRKAEAARAARGPQLRIASAQPRPLLCYDSLRNADTRFPKHTHLKEDDSRLFLYDIMPSPPSRTMSVSPPSTPSTPSPTDRDSLSLPRAQRELALKHAKSLSRSVDFSDVLTAMHGPLFEDDITVASPTRCSDLQTELLATLLEPAEKAEQKDREVLSEPMPRRDKAKNMALARVARSATFESISSSSSATSSSTSTVTRSGSWFSFTSRSSCLSDSTDLTSPSSSPPATAKPSIILSAPLSTSPPLVKPIPVCRRPSKPPISPTVLAVDHPLAIPASPEPKPKVPLVVGRGRALTRLMSNPVGPPPLSPTGLVHRVSRSVSNVIDFAAQLQRAYVKATMFTAGVDLYGRSPSRSGSRSPSHSPVRPARVRSPSVPNRSTSGLKPVGYRVCSLDVRVFTATDLFADDVILQYHRTLIPLCPPSPDAIPVYERVFPIPPPLPRSPFRRQFLPGEQLSRLRPVANPILLRLQALHNVCASHAIIWQRAAEGSLATGKEKVVGIAWDGIGRSGLGWEVGTVH